MKTAYKLTRYYFATNGDEKFETIYASRKKADIEALLIVHPLWKRTPPINARQKLELRNGVQFQECINGLWGNGYVPRVTRRWSKTGIL